MTLNEMIDLLNSDLTNEWKHLRFYLHHASLVTGLHAEEYKELLLEEAEQEMKHVTQFSDFVCGLGGYPTANSKEFTIFSNGSVRDILRYALEMEEEVVRNYVKRIEDAQELVNTDPVNARWIEIFLEKQIEDSRTDVDKLKQILRGI
jgi:bacterioferritin (cytochrome b1)